MSSLLSGEGSQAIWQRQVQRDVAALDSLRARLNTLLPIADEDGIALKENQLEIAQADLKDAQDAVPKAEEDGQRAIDDAQLAVEDAKAGVEDARAALEDTQTAVQDAQKALETGKIDLVLKWVKPDDETVIRKAFEKTREVRKLNPKAKELADMYFFETIVRIHRAGEGVAYTGILPAGTEVEPGIEAADNAVETGNGEDLAKKVSGHIAKTINERFTLVMEKKKRMTGSVEAGREYVEAYVSFIHYVEKLHKLASGAGLPHEGEGGAIAPVHQD